MLNVEHIKKDFSILKNNKELTYLDSAATSLTPDCVIEAMNEYYYQYRATVHRAHYNNGVLADQKYNNSRETIAKFLNASSEEIIFTKGTTNGMNLLARNLINLCNKNDIILTTSIEHHSSLLPFREIGKLNNIKTEYINFTENEISFNDFLTSINKNTKLVVLHHTSNVLGDTIDIEKICNYCYNNDIITIIDGAQAITHTNVDVKKINCDFYVFSSHKILGPTGLGIVYGRKSLLENMIFEYGGDMAHLVTHDSLTIKELPIALEAGTPPIAEVIGLGRAIEYLQTFDMNEVSNHIFNLKKLAIIELKKLDGVTIYNESTKCGILTFNVDLIPAHDALFTLEKENIAIRGGHMCNQLTLDYLGVNSVLRASFYLYNDENDVKKFIEGIKLVIEENEWMR